MIRLCVKQCVNSKTLLIQPKTFRLPFIQKCVFEPRYVSNTNIKDAKNLENNGQTERIYHGTLTPQIRVVKLFSIMSSAVGIVSQPILVREASTIGSTALLVTLCTVVGFFTFFTPFLLHLITKKYVTAIDYNPETKTYTAISYNFFLTERKTSFKVEDVEVPEIPGMFTTMKASGTPLFIEARHFTDPMHYAKIMGYDKPMDFKLSEPSSEDNSK